VVTQGHVDEAVDHLVGQEFKPVAFDADIFPVVANDRAIAGLLQHILDVGHDTGAKHILEIGDQDPDCHRPTGLEAPRQLVDAITQVAHGLGYRLAILLEDVAAIEVLGDRRKREPRLSGDIFYGDSDPGFLTNKDELSM